MILEYQSIRVAEREARLRQYVEDVRFIQGSRNRFGGWATSEATVWRIEKFINDYPDEVSPLDYFSLITSGRYSFSNPRYLDWADKAEAQINVTEHGATATAAAKLYLATAIIRSGVSPNDFNRADTLGVEAEKIVSEQLGMDQYSYSLEVSQQMANGYYHAGKIDRCLLWKERFDASLRNDKRAKLLPDWDISEKLSATTNCLQNVAGVTVTLENQTSGAQFQGPKPD